MISLRKSNVEKIMMSIKILRNDDEHSYMMPYDVSKEVSKEVQEMRKSYKMRAHV
jgi:spore cortex formation protein SpoVR/YcgB (stage V sporulation)